ncbi:MAG TPA: hypothetical protein VL995_00005 [Cellvibrio sp.]|nr:hypothetical protein [Cellvibrio sp.]
MPKVIFIGDDHFDDKTIKNNLDRFKKKYNLSQKYALLLEVDYSDEPETNTNDAVGIVTEKKTGKEDWAVLTNLASKADCCYGFDHSAKTFTVFRQNKQYQNIRKLIDIIRKWQPSMDIIVVVGTAHLEENKTENGWIPHHERLDKEIGNTYCYFTYEDGEEFDYDDS